MVEERSMASPQDHRALLFDPDDPQFVRDPHPVYAVLRERHPVFLSHLGIWVITRYEDVANALIDARLINEPAPYAVVNARNRDRYVCADLANNTLPFIEGTNHQRLRRVIAPAFHSLLKQSPVPFEEIALEVLKPYLERREIDVLNEFATPFTLNVLCRLLGFRTDDGPRLKNWSDYFFYLFAMIPSVEVREELDLALTEFRSYVGSIVEERKAARANDLISRLLDQRDAGAEFTDQELIDNCMLIFADGIGNVDSGFANVMASLTANPDQLELLYSDPEFIPGAIDECLRYETPGQFIARVASEELQLHGQTIKKNQAVFLVLGSANRDSAKFADPDRFDIRRENSSQYLSFGKGTHACVGAYLVKQQLQAALRVVLRELPGIQRKGEQLKWRTRFAHRWLQEFPIRFDR
jgi:pimeloyl-[acyl-carrier protein] synthase